MKQPQWKVSPIWSLEFTDSVTLKRPSPKCRNRHRRSGCYVTTTLASFAMSLA